MRAEGSRRILLGRPSHLCLGERRRILLGRPSHLRLGERRWHGDRLLRGRTLHWLGDRHGHKRLAAVAIVQMHELVRLLEPPCADKQPHLAPHAARQTRDSRCQVGHRASEGSDRRRRRQRDGGATRVRPSMKSGWAMAVVARCAAWRANGHAMLTNRHIERLLCPRSLSRPPPAIKYDLRSCHLISLCH